MGTLKKTKAIFEILILVLSIFSIYLMNTEEVYAQNKVCCEKTLDTSAYTGNYCIFSEPENCNSNFQYSSVACEQTDYCEPICCIKEGECSQNTYRAICLEEGGIPQEGANCDIQPCQKGCCVLPDQAIFATQTECADLIEGYSSLVLNEVFDPTITDEYTCLQQAMNQEEGCCVKSDGCTWGTRAECSSETGTFYLETLCSHPPLGCLVTAQHHVGCLEDEEEVYWFDSAGNPENIYGTPYRTDGKRVPKDESCDPDENNAEDINCGNCNYDLGGICSEASDEFLMAVSNSNLNQDVKNKLDYMCKDLNCYDLYTDPVNAERWEGERTPTDHGELHYNDDEETFHFGQYYRANGESWCQYEGKVGYGYDLVGSRHYMRYCENGVESFDPCNDKREEICIQNVIPEEISKVSGGISGAICTANLAGPCFGTVENPIDNQDDCEALEADCYWRGISGTDNGVCLPMIPPGGWEEDDETGCFGNIIATEYWTKEWGDWDCEANCFVNTKAFGNDLYAICRSLGDCGDYYNVIGEEGYKAGGNYDEGSFRITKPSGHAQAGSIEGFDFDPFTNFDGHNLKIADEFIDGGLFWWMFVSNYLYSKAMTNDFPEQTALRDSLIVLGSSLGLGWLTSLIIPSLGFLELIGWTFGGTATITSFATTAIGSTIMFIGGLAIVAAIIALVFVIEALFFREADEVPFTFTCEKWVPPVGGEDCTKCDTFTKCDEYKCMSLGAGCKFINDNGEEACIWENRGDTIPPLISPLPIVPRNMSDFVVTPAQTGSVQGGLNGGYEFKDGIEPYTDLEIGVNTNERAICKISSSPAKPFDQMTTNFGNGYLYNHTLKLESVSSLGEDQIAIAGAGDYTFYVKCMDASHGNQNRHDYFIKFKVLEGEDVMAPVIMDTSIENGAYLPHNTQNTNLMIYLNEQVPTFGGCKYSRQDKSYNSMEYNFTCLSSKVTTDYYGCQTTLDIMLNQENKFYFRCRDMFDNINSESYEYVLKSSDSLYITDSGPSGDVLSTQVNLEVETSGGAENGKAKCYYSLGSFFDPNGLLFQNTESATHSTELFLQNEQDYLFYVWCRDIAGNEDTTEITFHTTTPALNITNVEPENNSKFYLDGVWLEVTTIGGIDDNGDSTCRYNGILIPDKEIGTTQTVHSKNITGLTTGVYNYEIVCEDAMGVEDVKYLTFEVELNAPPMIIGIYTYSNMLNIILNRAGMCSYTNDDPNFNFEDGNMMVPEDYSTTKQAALGNDVYYILCRDQYGNINTSPYIIYP